MTGPPPESCNIQRERARISSGLRALRRYCLRMFRLTGDDSARESLQGLLRTGVLLRCIGASVRPSAYNTRPSKIGHNRNIDGTSLERHPDQN